MPGMYMSVVVIMVMWLVSVVVLPLLPFMPGMYLSVVVIMVMWLVSVVVLPLLPFRPGMYLSVVVIMVMWLVSVVVLPLLLFRLLLVLTKTVITTVGLVVIKTLSPDRGWHHADFLTHQGIDFGQGNLLQGSFAAFSLLECFSFPHGCRENDDIIYSHAVLQPPVVPREPLARLTAAASRYGDMHIVHLHSTSSPCQNPLHHRNCIC